MNTLRCATYNIRVGIETSLSAVGEALAHLGPVDVIAFQEIGHHWCMGERTDQVAALAAAAGLPHWAFAGALTDAQGGQFGVGLAARWPLDAVRRTALPRALDEQRVLLSARLASPVPVRLFVTHLSVKRAERVAQAALIGAAVAASAEPAVLLGDLNMGPDDPARAVCLGPLLDAYDTAGAGPPETFSVAAPSARIDYIAADPARARPSRCAVVRDARASDHFPLVAALALAAPKC